MTLPLIAEYKEFIKSAEDGEPIFANGGFSIILKKQYEELTSKFVL